MTRKRHTEEQIIAVLKDAQAGVSVQDLCRKHGISDATFYKWRAKYAGPGSQRCEEAAPTGRGKPATEANGGGPSVGHPGAEGDHRKKLVTPKAKRIAATVLAARFGLSQRRVCRLVALDRHTLRYRSRRADDQALRTRMREIAQTKRRYGSPRIYVRLRREGWQVNHKKVERIYREEGLSLRRRGRKKTTAVPRVALPMPSEPGRCYAMDFVHDRLATGRRFKCFTMTDLCSKEVPVIEVDASIGGERVCRILDRLFVDGRYRRP